MREKLHRFRVIYRIMPGDFETLTCIMRGYNAEHIHLQHDDECAELGWGEIVSIRDLGEVRI